MKLFLRLSLIVALVALPACGGKCSKKCCPPANTDATETLVVKNVVVTEECTACQHDNPPRISGVEAALNLK